MGMPMRWVRRADGLFLVIAILLMGAIVGTVRADEEERDDPETEAEVRIYDVADLVKPVRDYHFRSEVVPPTRLLRFGEREGSETDSGLFFPGPPTTRMFSPHDLRPIDELAMLLRENIAPHIWRMHGGTIGSINPYDMTLIIKCPPEVHEQVDNFLRALREGIKQRPRIGVTARWVRLNPEQVQRLDEGVAGPAALRDLDQRAPDLIAYSARITGYSGQTVHVASGRGRTVVIGVEPVAEANEADDPKAAGHKADVRMVLLGAALEITPTLTPEGDAVVAEVHSVVAEDLAEVPAADDALPHDRITRLDFTIQHFSTTVEVPFDEPTIIGGMTMEGPDRSAPLYLVLELTRQD